MGNNYRYPGEFRDVPNWRGSLIGAKLVANSTTIALEFM